MAKNQYKVEQTTPDLFPRLVQYIDGNFYDGNGNLIEVGSIQSSELQGVTGPQGFQGPQGPTGSQGPAGNTGTQGNTGPQGLQGPTGPGIEVTNYQDNRVLTSDGTSYGANAEDNLTFDGSLLIVNGGVTISGTLSVSGYSFPISDGLDGQFIYTNGSGILGWTYSSFISGGGGSQSMLAFEKGSDVTGSGTVTFGTTPYASSGTSFGTMSATGVFTFNTSGIYLVTVAFNVSANPDGWGGINGTSGTRYNQANGTFLKTSAVDIINVNTNDTYEWKVNNSVTVYGTGTTKTRIQFIKIDGVSGSGTTGPQGNTGPQGPTGADGPQGNQGFQGPTGSAGSAGNQGFQGPTGADGPQGNQGFQGSTGPSGAAGTQGSQGPTGSAGSAGNQGFQGPTGPQGNQGPQGYQGLTGSFGPALFTLTSSAAELSITSGNSIKKSGTNGGAASRANSVESYPYNSSFLTFRLNLHSSSDYGVALSNNGTSYTYGFSFQNSNVYLYYNNSFGSAISTYTTNDIFTVVAQSSGSYWYKNGLLIGTNSLVSGTSSLKFLVNLFTQNDIIDQIAFGQSLQGNQGAQGPIGPTGADGLQGPTGPAGATGADGLQGATGPAGATGADGLQGATGPAGATGADGLQGSTGPQGVTGPQGNQGPIGPTGPSVEYAVTGTASAIRVTGTTSNTLSQSLLIPANARTAGQVPTVVFAVSKTGGSNTHQPRLYWNTSASLVGAILIASNAAHAAAIASSYTIRDISIEVANGSGNGSSVFSTTSNSNNPYGAVTAVPSNVAINWTTTGYFIVAIQNASTTDSSICLYISLK